VPVYVEPVRTTPAQPGSVGRQLGRWARRVQGNTSAVCKSPKGSRQLQYPTLRPSRFADAICLDDLDTGAAACSNPEVLAGGELHVAERNAAGQTVAAAQTQRVLRLVTEILGPDVLGAYEHGSAVLGGVQPTSDIDILVITGRLATLVEKRQLVEGLMTISAPFPPLARSVVSR
jgi:hypothetical protein